MSANSGIEWIDKSFDAAVQALYFVAGQLSITYEEINVWLFCIIWPASMLVALLWIVCLSRRRYV